MNQPLPPLPQNGSGSDPAAAARGFSPEALHMPFPDASYRPRPSIFARKPTWLDLLDPRQPEAFLAFCSTWCAAQMWFWPNEFAADSTPITLNIGLRGHEPVWAVFGAIAALLKLTGLASRIVPRWSSLSEGMRMSGLFMSVVFWMVVGISRMLDFPHLVTPVALTGLGVAAAFELAERHDTRETWR